MDKTVDDLPESALQALQQLIVAKEHLRAGDFSAAQDTCRELLAEYTEYVEALCVFGRAYLGDNNPEAALPCFVRASMLSPDNPKVLMYLAEVYFELENDEAALNTASEALTLNPDEELEVRAHFLLGRLYERDSDYVSALAHLERVPAANPQAVFAALLSGSCRMELGEPKKAAKAYKAALKRGVSSLDHVQILYDLSQRPKLDEAKKILERIDALDRKTSTFEDDLAKASFTARINMARASILERLGEYKESWRSLEKGNTPLRTAYATASEGTLQKNPKVIALARSWNYAGPAQLDDDQDMPLSLLILGPSRAGKTILERLVASIRGVKSGHESEIVQRSVARTSMESGLLTQSFPGQLPSMLHGAFSKAYAEELLRRAGGLQGYTITHPGLITELGCIAATVPNMKVVFIERDADDTALRMFGKYYPEGTNFFAYDLARIYNYIEGYSELIDIWADQMSDISIRITYEDMIADPTAIVSSVAELCDFSAPTLKLPELGDDRGCAKPYLDNMNEARSSSIIDYKDARWA